MIAVNLMTMRMVFMAIMSYRFDHDLENLQDLYGEILDMAKAAGYEGVDVMSYETDLLGAAYVKEQFCRRGLRISSFIYFNEFAKGDSTMPERISAACRAADIAIELGTKVLMLVPAAHQGIEQESREDIHRRLIEHWRPVVSYAVQKGLHPVVEDTPDLRMHLCTAKDVLDVMDQVPGLELVYDSGNMVLAGEDPVSYLRAFSGRIGYVHLKDIRIANELKPNMEKMADGTPVETVATGTGMIDMAGIFQELQNMNYEGEVTVEFAKHPTLSYTDSLRICRDYVGKGLNA